MKLPKLFPFIFLISVSFLSTSVAEDETPMTKEMKTAGKALKKLRVTDAEDWTELAKIAKEANEAFLRSMSYDADIIKYLKDEGKKKIALADSRRMMGLCYAALCELELAYLKKDKELVDAAYKKFKDLKSDGHELYTNE